MDKLETPCGGRGPLPGRILKRVISAVLDTDDDVFLQGTEVGKLETFVAGAGGCLGEGWTAKRRLRTAGIRAGAYDTYYISPDGEVTTHLQVTIIGTRSLTALLFRVPCSFVSSLVGHHRSESHCRLWAALTSFPAASCNAVSEVWWRGTSNPPDNSAICAYGVAAVCH